MPIIETPSKGAGFIKTIIFIVIGIVVISIINPIVIISAGERGVMTTFGKPDELVFEPGIHFRIPLAQTCT